jgi:glutathione S-transferase
MPNSGYEAVRTCLAAPRLAACIERCTAQPAFKRAFDAQIGDFKNAA